MVNRKHLMKIKPQFEEEYYYTAVNGGVDLNNFGFWQKNYAKMVIYITDIIQIAANNKQSTILDIGCACGVALKGFKETKVFKNHIGVDISTYMINLGKQTHEFTDDELKITDITKEPLPCENDSVTLINCSGVIEHIAEDKLTFVFNEMYRVLNNEGIIFIITNNDGINKIDTIKSKLYSVPEINRNFQETKFGPSLYDKRTFYDHYKDMWSIVALKK